MSQQTFEIRLAGQPAEVLAEFILGPCFDTQAKALLAERAPTDLSESSLIADATTFLKLKKARDTLQRWYPWVMIFLIILCSTGFLWFLPSAPSQGWKIASSIVSIVIIPLVGGFFLWWGWRLDVQKGKADYDLRYGPIRYLIDLEKLLNLPTSKILAMSREERKERADRLLINAAVEQLTDQRKLKLLNREDPGVVMIAATNACYAFEFFTQLFNKLKEFHLTDSTVARYYYVAEERFKSIPA